MERGLQGWRSVSKQLMAFQSIRESQNSWEKRTGNELGNSGEENLTFVVLVGISQEILAPPDFRLPTAFPNSSHLSLRSSTENSAAQSQRRRRPWETQCTKVVQSVFLWVNLELKMNCKKLVYFSADASFASTQGFLVLVIPDVCHCSALCPVNSTETVSGFLIKQTSSPQSPSTFYYKHSHQFSCTNSLWAKSNSTWHQTVFLYVWFVEKNPELEGFQLSD